MAQPQFDAQPYTYPACMGVVPDYCCTWMLCVPAGCLLRAVCFLAHPTAGDREAQKQATYSNKCPVYHNVRGTPLTARTYASQETFACRSLPTTIERRRCFLASL